jgi:predicted HAD superfamily Cof-like phosphohydrolase
MQTIIEDDVIEDDIFEESQPQLELSPDAIKFNVVDDMYNTIHIDTKSHDNGVNHVITTHVVDKSSEDADYEINNDGYLSLHLDSNYVDLIHGYIAQNMKMTNSHKVKQFTEESKGVVCPNKPEKMNRDEVSFLVKMILSELTELAQTVCDSPQESVEFVRGCVGVDLNRNYKKPTSDVEIIAQQVDAGVDMWYYYLNAMTKKGINSDQVFNTVHQANMDKKWNDGKFHCREDSKIIKRPGWEEDHKLDVVSEIERQIKHGSW